MEFGEGLVDSPGEQVMPCSHAPAVCWSHTDCEELALQQRLGHCSVGLAFLFLLGHTLSPFLLFLLSPFTHHCRIFHLFPPMSFAEGLSLNRSYQFRFAPHHTSLPEPVPCFEEKGKKGQLLPFQGLASMNETDAHSCSAEHFGPQTQGPTLLQTEARCCYDEVEQFQTQFIFSSRSTQQANQRRKQNQLTANVLPCMGL